MRKPGSVFFAYAKKQRRRSATPLFSLYRLMESMIGFGAETRKSQASFQIVQVLSEALPRMRIEKSEKRA